MHAMPVLGPVDAAELGVVLPHEHIIIDLRHHAFSVEAILDDPDLAVDELQRFRVAGGGVRRSAAWALRIGRSTSWRASALPAAVRWSTAPTATWGGASRLRCGSR